MQEIHSKSHLAKWGNSQAVRIPQAIVQELNLTGHEELTISVKDGSIVLTPTNKIPNTIQDLFADWHDDGNRDSEYDWGEPVGRELKW
ncbi:AbrB/MazE/SpoVT family DNA-binding domain-containing protein [Levilactobacillus namurensis]|uniref:AbrB/MazE/SpoVT family DNA-binding domain-containing protein n=1 Tax=Levilactobacillus namurensis TaxID=380393 RepID=UPI0026E96545|nr:AbrB/MazE/SpoVT family DNA-binding domain-containing protein [Levilactobacillus namurensis]